MKVAIMQPTYLPWIGYFGLMDRVDRFIFLDSVQFSRQSWQQRNRIKTASGAMWLIVPIVRSGLFGPIKDIQINASHLHEKHIRAIETNYRKTPYFERYSPELFAILRKKREYLASLNIDTIMWLRDTFGIITPLLRSSEINCSGAKTKLLVNLCKAVGASEYISPPGSKVYLDESDAFEKTGIPVRYHNYEHPQYPQLFGEFLPYMSAIDLLFNVGPDSLSVIRSGVK